MAVDNPNPLGKTAGDVSRSALGSVLGGVETIAQVGALFGLVNNGTADALLAAESFKNFAAGRTDGVQTAGRLMNALVDYKVYASMEENGHSPFFSKITAMLASSLTEKVVDWLGEKIAGGMSKDTPLSGVVDAARKQFGGQQPVTASVQEPSSGVPPMGQPAERGVAS